MGTFAPYDHKIYFKNIYFRGKLFFSILGTFMCIQFPPPQKKKSGLDTPLASTKNLIVMLNIVK